MTFGLDNYFYHGSIRRYIGLFGSLFTNIHTKRKNGDKEEYFRVPLKFGPGNRYMNADQGEGREQTKVSRIVPAMMFELKTFYKDVSRKTNSVNIISKRDFDEEGMKTYMYNRIPYNFIFELSILTKNIDDMLQITEQIIPAFDPNMTVTVEDIDNSVVDVEQDIPISIQEIHIDDNYDEDAKRMVDYKITFELKGFLYKKPEEGYIVKEAILLAYFNEFNSENYFVIDNITEQPPIQEEHYTITDQNKQIESSLFSSVGGV